MKLACVCHNKVHEKFQTHPPPGQLLPAAPEGGADCRGVLGALAHLFTPGYTLDTDTATARPHHPTGAMGSTRYE
jgi:hypothetical protein